MPTWSMPRRRGPRSAEVRGALMGVIVAERTGRRRGSVTCASPGLRRRPVAPGRRRESTIVDRTRTPPAGGPMSGSVIVAGARTPMGRLLGGLKDLSAADLGGVAIKGALARAG